MVGKNLSHYKILEELGRGGMGIVYKAEDSKLGRMVALKVLPAHLTADENARLRFEQEAIAASSLEHPNICTIHHVGETDDGQFYIVMPCYEGQTLAARIQEGSVDIDEAVSISRQILGGLQKAHDAGIVHRDIKPANVMLVDGRAVIMDFGLAKLVGGEDITKTGSTVGSLAYMSPEQAKGEDLDSRSDLWSVGVLLYEMLAGRRPFKAPYSEAQLYAVLNTNPEAIDTVRPGTPPWVTRVVHRLLEKEADNRYSAAREVLEDIDLKLDSSPDTITATKVPRWRLGSARISLVTIVALAIVSLIAFQLNQSGSTQPSGIRSLAIFPLAAGIGTEPQIAEEATNQIIEKLKHLDALPVSPLSEGIAQLATGVLPPEAAAEMGVDMYMTGDVTQKAGLFSIEIFLNDTHSDVLLWNEVYEGSESDILNLYNDVARGIIGTSGFVLSAEEEHLISRNRTISPEAYRLLTQGRATRNANTVPDYRRGIEYLKQAIEIDSTLAEAFSELGNLYVLIATIEGMADWPKAVQAAEHAIRLDSLDHLAWTTLGIYHLFFTWDWDESERSLTRALSISPRSIEARSTLALLLTSREKRAEARQELRRIRQYNAHTLGGRYNSLLAFQFNGDYEEGIDFARETLGIYPNGGRTIVQLATLLALTGKFTEAIAELDKVMPKPGEVAEVSQESLGLLWIAYGMVGYALAGADDKARALLPELEEEANYNYFCKYELALVHVQLGAMDRAFDWLSKAVDEHAMCVPFMQVDERLDPFRSDPRYQGLVDRVGF